MIASILFILCSFPKLTFQTVRFLAVLCQVEAFDFLSLRHSKPDERVCHLQDNEGPDGGEHPGNQSTQHAIQKLAGIPLQQTRGAFLYSGNAAIDYNTSSQVRHENQ